jgi:hypothetical protein
VRKIIAIVAALVVLSGCSAGANDRNAVIVAEYQRASQPFKSLKEFVAQRPIIATGKVVAVNELAYEIPVDPAAEGNREGDGAETYGKVTFQLDSVIRGDVKAGGTLTIVYLSGQWQKADKKTGRVAYTHEKMTQLQKQDSTLKKPAELGNTTFAIFAAPNDAGTSPVREPNLYVAGIAAVGPAGQLTFTGDSPFLSGTGKNATLSEVKALT